MTFHQLRWMIRRDMPRVVEIESACFEFPWCESDFISSLRARNVIGIVVEVEESVHGFMIYELHPHRIHLANIAVAPEWHGNGLAMAMISYLQAKLNPERRDRIVCQVRETNLRAQLFFKSMDFQCVQIRKNFYEDSTEDAYQMRFDVPSKKTGMDLDPVKNRIAKYMQA